MDPFPPPPSILVVDDDEGLVLLVDKALRREGWNVASAGSGAEARAWLDAHSADLLLLDLKLRDTGGAEFIATLEKAGLALPFVVITGQGDERMAVEMMKRGAMDYLVKDLGFIEFVPVVVRHALERVVEKRRMAMMETERENLFRLVECSHDFIALADLDGRITFMNGGARRMIGLAEGQDPSRLRLVDYVPPLWRKFLVETVLPIARTRGLWEGEMQLMHLQTGELIDVFRSTFVVRDASGDAVAFGSVTRDITDRKRLEKEILEISEREQLRFGRDLHDGLGQRLTALELFAHSLMGGVQQRAPDLVEPFRELRRELRETIRLTRKLSHGLAPVTLKEDGLAHALRSLADTTAAMTRIDCRFVGEPSAPVPDATAAMHLYRIAQEAVNNALKHGQASEILISLAVGRGVELKVEDDGRGLPATSTSGDGMGLQVMRYRADLIGASLEINSSPGKGCTVTCTLPQDP